MQIVQLIDISSILISVGTAVGIGFIVGFGDKQKIIQTIRDVAIPCGIVGTILSPRSALGKALSVAATAAVPPCLGVGKAHALAVDVRRCPPRLATTAQFTTPDDAPALEALRRVARADVNAHWWWDSGWAL